MKKLKILMLLLTSLALSPKATAQSLAGDSIVFGPMFSPVYHDSVRVWVLTKTNTGSNDVLSLEVTGANAPGAPLQGTVHNADERLGYVLRSFAYANLASGQTYTAVLKKNGVATTRKATIKNGVATIDDFEFLTGGCARIYDLSRCIDRPESQTHKNGTPDIFNTMAREGSDMMVWLGDATYLLGLQHAMGQCLDGTDDWANKDMAFARYIFYRKFQDNLLAAMPQLAITDNHDTGPNEFDKTMPTLGEMRDIFKDWWPNPEYKSTSEGPGLFSSYVYKDVEYFLLDNRSYRDGISQQLGPEQMEWFKKTLKNSTATFKVIISGTPAFAKQWGGRNFSVTQQGDELIKFIQDNNIDGVLCFAADIHEQEFYGMYDTKYPLFDILSGNLNSDVGDGVIYVDQANDRMMHGVKQSYVRVNVFGPATDRRMKVEYVDEKGVPYYQVIIHADMLKSLDNQTRKLALSFANALYDSSSYHHALSASGVSYEADKNGAALSAMKFTATSQVQVPYSAALGLNDRAYAVSYWVNPAQFPASGAAVLSNATTNTGVTFSITKDGYLAYTDHATGNVYTSTQKLIANKWAHITWKYDNVKQLLSLYYNGLFVQNWTGVKSSAASTAALRLGNSVENKPFTGLLDELRITGRLVSDETIRQESGYESNRGDVLKVTTSTMAIPGSKINPVLSGDFTIEFWGKLNGDPGTNMKILASNGRVNNNSTGFSFEFPDSNKLNIVIGNNGSGWTTISEQGSAWKIGEWNHVAVSAKKGGTLMYYVNGVKIAETAFNGYIPNDWGMGLGYSPAYSGNVAAELDELRFWNVALSQDSIVKRMFYPLKGSEAGLSYYYDFSAHTPTSVISKGVATPHEMTLTGASLTSGTSPIGNIDAAYRNLVTANWSRGSYTNTGLVLPDAISSYTGNVVVGKGKFVYTGRFAQVGATDVYYNTAAWQIDPVNMPFATLRFNMSQALPNYDSIAKKASQYYLLQKNQDGTFNTISQGSYDGQNVTFFNVFLEEAKYYLGWRANASGAIGRGGVLSLTAGHNASIPYTDLNPVLAGPFTVELWARLMQDPPSSGKLLSSNGRLSNNNTTGLSVEFTEANSANVVLGTNTGNWITMSTNKNWKVGEWYHLALTFTPNGQAVVYLNGEKMANAAVTSYVPNTNWNLALGASVNPSYINGTESIVMMDEFRIWNRVKTQEEIRQQMHLTVKDPGTSLLFNYTGDQEDTGSLINSGTLNNAIPYTKAQIVAATSPVSDVDPVYTDIVSATWSASTEKSNGLFLNETVTNVTENVITGRDKDNHILMVASLKDVYYVKGAWLLNAQNRAEGSLAVDLANVFPNADSVIAVAKEYYLIQGDPTGNFKIAATATPAGNTVTFPSLPLDFGTYYLGYKADVNAIIGNQGGVLSLAKGHNVTLPYADVNKAMAGDFTLELWAKLNQDPASNAKLIGFSSSANSYFAGFEFEFLNNNAPQTILGKGTNNGWNTISSNTPWAIGEWNHVAVTVSPNREFKFYVNGQLIGTNAVTTFQPNTYNLAFATNLFNANESLVSIDEFRIWNKVKTQQEIQNGMHLGVATTDPTLVYNLTFDQSNEGKIKNTGTLGGTFDYTAAQILPATSPVRHDIAATYQGNVAASWSLINSSNNGLYLNDKLTDLNANLVIGRDVNNQILPFPSSADSLYVKGGWLLDPLTVTTGTVNVDLRKIVANPMSIVSQAGEWFLMQGDPAKTPKRVATGTYKNNVVQFPGVSLDSGVYFLTWKTGKAAPVTGSYQISSGIEDVEQYITSGKMYTNSSDLEFTVDESDQLIGLKFRGIDIPQGAEIKEAYLQFTVDEVNTTGDVNLVIAVEDVADPLDFSTFDFDLTHRLVEYGDTIIWKPGAFAKVGDAGADQRTPNVGPLLNSIVNRADWKAGNAVVFRLADPVTIHKKGYTGNTGKRVAQAYENNAANGAKLIVSYTIPQRYYNGTFPMARNASWKYDDSGKDRTGTDWTSPNFKDSDWTYGNATLGYGKGDESTILSFGDDVNNKHITYYLRNIFEVKDHTKYGTLLFDVRRDDGAIVYVNGKEAFRMNMPEGAVTASTLASSAVEGADETTYYRAKAENLLQDGINVIAVELHQASATSTDLSFDMEIGYEQPPLGPATYPMPKETEWHYLDNGTSLDDVAWKGLNYKDAEWATGKGSLGYGDPMNTIISYGPDANNKYTTAYFRRTINVNLASLPDKVELGLRRDDGAIIYVNGVEVVRDNMPAGVVTYSTFSSTTIDGSAETTYYPYLLPKSIFVDGVNQIAVELHNRSANSSDLGFDLYIKDAPVVNPPAECDGKHISCFTSIVPTGQTDKMIIPNDHKFQMLFREGDKYTIGGGTVPGNNDFTAYLPIDGSSEKGRLSVNHENTPGGVSIVNVHFNSETQLWAVDSSQPVDLYNNNLVTTTRNCSGGITPWGTVITAEESLDGGDQNGDGYQDVGWLVEIDPVTAKVMDYGNGKQEKLWALGRMNHENVMIKSDRTTAYYGEDGGTHCLYKFVADVPGNLTTGTVYVLKLDNPLVNDDPSTSTATWVKVPNATQADRNNMVNNAQALGGTNFNGVEDVEIGTLDGKIYFTSKGKNRVYRFKDNGTNISEFETFVGGRSYDISTAQGTFTEAWGDGNDNLTFDDRGNLWVLQDGGLYYIWVIRPGHTQSSPQVELFASMPAGSEPTGLTFTPDYRFGFFSVQHPSGSNAVQPDVTLNDVRFNVSSTIVFALNEDLGPQLPKAEFTADKRVVQVGQSVVFTDASKYTPTSRKWTFDGGTPATSDKAVETVTYNATGSYTVSLEVTNSLGSDIATIAEYIEVTPPAPVADFSASAVKILAGQTVAFNDLSTNSPNRWEWTFAGGSPATSGESAPIVMYASPGFYDVTLVAAHAGGASAPVTKSRYIEVENVLSVESPFDKSIGVYPNPTDGEFTINIPTTAGKDLNVELYDLMGRKLSTLATGKTTGAGKIITVNLKDYVYSTQLLILRIKAGDDTAQRMIQFVK